MGGAEREVAKDWRSSPLLAQHEGHDPELRAREEPLRDRVDTDVKVLRPLYAAIHKGRRETRRRRDLRSRYPGQVRPRVPSPVVLLHDPPDRQGDVRGARVADIATY